MNLTKTYSEELREMYKSLPVKHYLQVRAELMDSCGWSYNTFYARLNGRGPIKALEVPIIRSVFAKYGYDIYKPE